MTVLDANYLIDYLNGEPATKEFYEEHGGREERWITPAPAYAETIVGVGNLPEGDVDRAIDALAWVDVVAVTEELSIEAARIADEIGSQGPFLDGVDALVAALGRTRDATVVSSDSDLTHPETKQVVDVTDY